jgi:2,4-dienoyl-CoA reductase-like NADH-dependent reductase (Old Yellow Enzyme family)
MREKYPMPHDIGEEEIDEFIQDCTRAAQAAVFKADLHSINVHADNSYLVLSS